MSNESVDMIECYENGNNCYNSKDYENAVKWYLKSAKQGYAEAQNKLGFMYDEGKGVVQDHKMAVAWYLKAAEQGHALAQYTLGFMYTNGLGVPQDSGRAVLWYSKAAEQGYALAQYTLNIMNDYNRRVQQLRETEE